MSYLLLITHSAALFPMSIFLWSWKNRKEHTSILLFIKFVFCVTFSIMYHTYDVDTLDTIESHKRIWTLLDGYNSTTLIFTATLYGLRVRSPQFYITMSSFETLLLVIYLFENYWFITTWILILSCGIVAIFKWRTIYRYLIKYYFLSFITIIFAILAAVNFTVAIQSNTEDYIKYHSLWHCFIFSTAGCGALLRYKLNEELYPIIRRNTLDSI